jgi:hyaluronan synthase/N-acetylglucosaminyltransferase
MTSILLDVIRVTLGWIFLVYTVVAATHFILQLWYSHRTYRRQASPQFAREFPDYPAAVDVLIPVYNEDPALLEACVRSSLAQDHPGRVKVIVIDDGSPNRANLEPVYAGLERDGVIVVRAPRNNGKRHAQGLGLAFCEGELIVTLDSDTILRPDAIRMLTRQFRDPRVGAATGFVDVDNYRKNFLTRLQRLRYWMAFNQERAAQSWFRTMLCCSGPLAAYRREIIERVRDAYLGQVYGGVPCTFGDDRHLTNLVLGEGYDTVFDSGAVGYTHVPEGLRQFVQQQLRWSKSFYRELIWTMPYIGQRPWYSRFDLVAQVAMPLMLTLTVPSALLLGVLLDPAYIVHFVVLIAVVAAIRSTYPAVRNRDPSFYLFVLYGFVSAFLMMSVRVLALSTLTDSRWGTRGPRRSRTAWPLSGTFGRRQLALAAAGASDGPGTSPPDQKDHGAASRGGAQASFDADVHGTTRAAPAEGSPRRVRERRASRSPRSASRSGRARNGPSAPPSPGR